MAKKPSTTAKSTNRRKSTKKAELAPKPVKKPSRIIRYFFFIIFPLYPVSIMGSVFPINENSFGPDNIPMILVLLKINHFPIGLNRDILSRTQIFFILRLENGLYAILHLLNLEIF